ncbi:bifunctional glycosyltransferase/class I SAM-dependent methyltransferase [Waltera intestinalis]|uniref:Methyltransferase domain-containing protein n=1 Tax=Waltera intestinalis TaxID=2606635 RepID=A0A6L5YKB9_9FIRM|nr:bifunctional glycosyltransferase/class I SAM-dependent methyltransferase [Waltera intestinalis]MST58846.1 methyltransferase domain-containing protein [Waltera intestinalis]
MGNVSAIIFVNEDISQGIATIDSIRTFNDIDDLSVIVVDNTDGGKLFQWAQEQLDITYIYMDEGPQTFSEIFNGVMSEVKIDSDVLLIDEGMTIVPQCLSTMKAILDSESDIGAVGGVSNGFCGCQNRAELASYSNAINMALSMEALRKRKRTLNLDSAAILWKRETIRALGKMDEDIGDRRTSMLDYCIRATLTDWKLMICPECLWWDVQKGCRAERETLQIQKLEKKWKMHYFNWLPNYCLIDLIDREDWENFNVLEVGCDCGATLLEIKNIFPNVNTYGSELNPNAAKVAMHVTTIQINNIEEQTLNFEQTKFDYIIFGDVLEHLRDPQAVIEFCRKILKEDGCIIACIPNIMHISVMKELLNGRFEYTETGLLDKTHVHFFTYFEIEKMFQQAGYEMEVVSSKGISLSANDEILMEALLDLSTETQRFMYETFQYIVRARKDKF